MSRVATAARLSMLGILCHLAVASLPCSAEPLTRLNPGTTDGISAAVVVDNVPLVFSTQLLPLQGDGTPIAGGATVQSEYLLTTLEGAFGAGTPERLVKLNFTLASDAAAAELRAVLATRYAGPHKPAVSFVVGQLPRGDVQLTLDAIAVDAAPGEGRLVRRPSDPLAALAVNPGDPHLTRVMPGSFVFIAGQAEKGDSIADATRNTMKSLAATLQHLGLSFADVVSVRSFLSPVTETPAALQEIRKFYTGPQSFVEWLSPGTIEIELIAAAPSPAAPPGDPVEFLTPPGMQPSPVFSRVARTHGRSLIFVSGLYGKAAQTPADEVAEIFQTLEQILKPAGSNLRHLAKATYFVATEEASLKLNELRPRYYDPQRPPAASKASVTGSGLPGKTLTLDMIAVPAPRE